MGNRMRVEVKDEVEGTKSPAYVAADVGEEKVRAWQTELYMQETIKEMVEKTNRIISRTLKGQH